MGRYALILIAILGCASCQQEVQVGPVDPASDTTAYLTGRRLVIGCEGNFQYNNASITVYSLESGDVTQEVYRSANGDGIGDVLQDMIAYEGKIVVSVNNSGKVLILNDSTWIEEGRIEGLNSPRRLYLYDEQTAIVSELYQNRLNLIDLKDQELSGSINFEGWSEGMLEMEEKLWVANMTDSTLDHISFNTGQLESQIQLKFEPRHMDTTQSMAFFAGNGGSNGWVMRWNDELRWSKQFEERVTSMDAFNGWCYILEDGRVTIYNEDLVRIGGFDHTAESPYSIYVSKDGIFIADVKDFISKGEVLFYDHQHRLVDRIPTGYIPQSMLVL